jgi:hypothetical protein
MIVFASVGFRFFLPRAFQPAGQSCGRGPEFHALEPAKKFFGFGFCSRTHARVEFRDIQDSGGERVALANPSGKGDGENRT